ncbi:hypothetical protein AB0D47_20175 [Streptomyces sp. NPDC048376]|uniref:hypothetical protein n=1 Tax=Streptomyces sp. NPDC048376 TaxID=3154926 RepID=UPI0034450A37
MSRYLEEAASLLRKASTEHERNYADGLYVNSANEGRERIARGFAALAAIDKGLLPAEITQDLIRTIVEHRTA